MNFITRIESNNEIVFLGVLVSCREDGLIRLSAQRKAMQMGQFTYFHSFVLLSRKRKLNGCPINGAKRKYAEDIV